MTKTEFQVMCPCAVLYGTEIGKNIAVLSLEKGEVLRIVEYKILDERGERGCDFSHSKMDGGTRGVGIDHRLLIKVFLDGDHSAVAKTGERQPRAKGFRLTALHLLPTRIIA
jgi:hypothetical protein